jgi:hypothetical protein
MSEDQYSVPLMTAPVFGSSEKEWVYLTSHFKTLLNGHEEALLPPVDTLHSSRTESLEQAKGVLLYAEYLLRKQDLRAKWLSNLQLLHSGFGHVAEQLLKSVELGNLSLEGLVSHPLLDFDENGFVRTSGLEYADVLGLVNGYSLVYAVHYR